MRDRLLLSVGWAVPLALVLTFAVVLAGQPDHRPVKVGLADPAPEFVLRTFVGPSVTLSGLRGRPVLLHFWASWSDLCNAEAVMTERIWREYRGRGLSVVGIVLFDYEHNARAFARRYNFTFSNGLDVDGISSRYRVIDVPERYFIDSQGQIVRRRAGPISEAELRSYLDELLELADTGSPAPG